MERLNIAPTKSNLLAVKEQLQTSKAGYDLLEEKRQLLVKSLMGMLEEVKEVEKEIDTLLQKAYPAFIKLLLSMGADNLERIECDVSYDFGIVNKKVSIGGLNLDSIEASLPKKTLPYSIIGTSASLDSVVDLFFNLLSALTKMASIRSIVWRLAAEVKKTQRRVNALDKLVIPQTTETKKYIENSLEEKERENIFTLKALKKKNIKK